MVRLCPFRIRPRSPSSRGFDWDYQHVLLCVEQYLLRHATKQQSLQPSALIGPQYDEIRTFLGRAG